MLTLHCDRSELFNPSRVVVVSGLLAEDDEWVKVDADWRTVLQRFEVERFHMTDFETRQGPFDWSNERRVQFLTELVDVLRGRVLVGVSCGIVIQDYEQLEQGDRDVITHPYVFCASYVAGKVLEWVDREFNAITPVNFVFESGDEGAGILAESLSRRSLGQLADRVSSVSFRNCRDLMGLQAADLMAYEYAKILPRRLGTESRPTRKLLEVLADAIPIYGAYFASRGLRDFADENRLIRACAEALRAGREDEVSRLIRTKHAERGGKTGWPNIFSPDDRTS